jgi:hypothetical protein
VSWCRLITVATLLVFCSTARYAEAQATSEEEEKEWLEQQDEAPDDDAEEAWIEEQDSKTDVDTDLELRPGSWGAPVAPTPENQILTPPPAGPAITTGPGAATPTRTEAAEPARVRGPSREEDMIPLRFIWHGYYRTRYNWIGNTPLPSNSDGDFPNARASYGTMRLRLDPEVTYGPNPDLPIARLRFTIDGFDNVVFGDNARVFGTPLFSTDQSLTNEQGFDLRDSLKLERAWIEFLVPVGQMRVGRMESHFGVGLLTHAGNGLAEWGDFMTGETFDRILFVTRPMTIGRTIKSGDGRQTPLIYAFAYDRLSQDQVVDPTIGRPPAATDYQFQPFRTSFADRSTAPFEYLTNLDRRVNEIVNVVAWFDEDWGKHVDDELFAGVYVVYRWQDSTKSKIPIVDAAWRLQHQVGDRGLAIQTEGEFYTILGHSGALRFTGGCPPEPCNKGKAGIYNVLGRVGLTKPGKWGTRLEGGFASGDDNMLFNDKLTTRGFNTNVKVGLLTYQVALLALSYDAFSPFNALELGANGSVFNAKYLYPQARFTIVPGLELHATMLFSYAAKLDPVIYAAQENKCGLKGKCWMGWETNLALRARIGEADIVWVDLEGGFMQPGGAFKNAGFSDDWLWTIQMRAAMVF